MYSTSLFTIALLLLLAGFSGCERDFSPVIPEFDAAESILRGTQTLKEDQRQACEGVYRVTDGSPHFGEEVVLRFAGKYPSIFCPTDGAYMILETGRSKEEILFEGYWRKGLNLRTGRIQIRIAAEDGGSAIVAGDRPESIAISGIYDRTHGEVVRPLRLEYLRPLRTSPDPFYVIGHRGGGRNSDFLPHSENSLEMIRFAPRLGCNAVEIDVLLTADSIPILFHDLDFSTRLVEADHMIGAVNNYTFTQIRRFSRLAGGEQIPTLEEALAVIEETPEIELVWVDVKTPETMEVIAPILKAWEEQRGTDSSMAEVLTGLPLVEIYNAYTALSPEERSPALCELTVVSTREIDAAAWAPRWTLGLRTDLLNEMKAEGRHAFVWTLDIEEIIGQYIEAGYTGILTNYPGLVAWNYYTGGDA